MPAPAAAGAIGRACCAVGAGTPERWSGALCMLGATPAGGGDVGPVDEAGGIDCGPVCAAGGGAAGRPGTAGGCPCAAGGATSGAPCAAGGAGGRVGT